MNGNAPPTPPPTEAPLGLTLPALAAGIRSRRYSNILVLSGAGMSVAAGIPDFRSPGGLYDRLRHQYQLSDPTEVFNLARFKQRPQLFYAVAKTLFSDHARATRAHHFIKGLHDRGLLLRHYTQNIDMLDDQTSLPDSKLIEAHGAPRAAHCVECHMPANMVEVWDGLRAGLVVRCRYCQSPVKPDIVFFGEALPASFGRYSAPDLTRCDLVIVIGTSLKVFPFAGMLGALGPWIPRVLINRESVGAAFDLELLGEIEERVAELEALL